MFGKILDLLLQIFYAILQIFIAIIGHFWANNLDILSHCLSTAAIYVSVDIIGIIKLLLF